MTFLNPQLTKSLQAYMQSPKFRLQKSGYSSEDVERIVRYGGPLGSIIETHQLLSRCMGRLKELAQGVDKDKDLLPSGAVVISKQLQDGCGRFDRMWHAPKGGLWLAVAWADTLLPEFSRLLPLATGAACCQAVRNCSVSAATKWVNDVHVRKRKIAGILCETITGVQSEDCYHLIGIGINCNNTSFPSNLRENATSIRLELGETVDLEKFTIQFLAELSWCLGLVHLAEEQYLAWKRDGASGEFRNPVIEEWRGLSDTVGRKVVYGYDVVKKPLYRAVVKDVDPFGGLVLQLENGTIVTENSGEIVYEDTL